MYVSTVCPCPILESIYKCVCWCAGVCVCVFICFSAVAFIIRSVSFDCVLCTYKLMRTHTHTRRLIRTYYKNVRRVDERAHCRQWKWKGARAWVSEWVQADIIDKSSISSRYSHFSAILLRTYGHNASTVYDSHTVRNLPLALCERVFVWITLYHVSFFSVSLVVCCRRHCCY